jgi:transcriptional antiterminator NusG
MDIHENEEQVNEVEPVSGDAQPPEKNMESALETPEGGEELQSAPAAEEVEQEDSSLEDQIEEPALEAEEEDISTDIPEILEAEDSLVAEEEEPSQEVEEILEDESTPEIEEILEEQVTQEAEAIEETAEEADPTAQDQESEVETEDLSEEDALEEISPTTPEVVEPAEETQQEETAPDPYASVTVQDETVKEPDDGRVWYVVHCYSGNEDKVRHNIMQRIESMSMDDLIFDVVVPTEDEVNIKNGERQTVEKKVFPGYILVNMILTEESWYMVRNTPGVTGFVGMGNDPTPLQPEEVARILKRMESESPRINVTFRAGERVRIVDGPFEDFYGKVAEIDMERATVRVMVNFFGRETPVELDFLQVEQA